MGYIDELEKRRKNDNRAMRNAFSDLVSIVSDKRMSEENEALSQDAIEEVLKYFSIKPVKVPEEIMDLKARLDYILSPSGIMRRRVELEGSWWKDTDGVLLGSTVDGGTFALTPAFPYGYTFFDKDLQKRVKVNANTVKKLNRDAFCFYRPLPAKKLKLTDLGSYIIKSISNTDIAFVLGASLLVSLLGMFTPFMNKQIFDSVIPSGTKSDVFPVAGLLIGAALGSALFGITRGMILLRLRDKINISVQSAAMARIFSLPAAFFGDFSSGELSSRALSINTLCALLSDTVLTTGLSAIFSFVYIFQMQSFASVLVMPGLLIILTMFVFTLLTGFVQQKLSKKEKKISAKLNGLVFELFNGVQKVKLAGAEKRAFSKWAKSYREQGRLTYSPPMFLRLNKAITGVLILGGTLVLYYFAGVGKVSASDYIAFSIAYGNVSGAIMAFASVITTLADVKPLLNMVQPILEAVPEIGEGKKQVTSLKGDIELSNVAFRYTEGGPLILDNVSLKVKRGEYVAIVGRSGCGKSTLMKLLLGFVKPESGAVYYDGNDIAALDVQSVRQRIGTCLQNGKLFSGDIFSNIIVTAPSSLIEDAWSAARKAGLEDDICSMPMGMNTMISEGSGGISGGQRQRILIARALVSKPEILLFDEATSALDNTTQKNVSESLSSLGCTRIVIAHRLSTVINCDRIIVLDKGKIVEEGNYDELMERKGYFYEFAIRQVS